ncbi:MAG: heparinase II/III family protein [Rhizobacter sp.]|nr:heparinase II/III family protein [Ferruginibacter sp.]
MIKQPLAVIVLILFNTIIFSQIKVGLPVQNNHPRLLAAGTTKAAVLSRIQNETAAKNIFEQVKKSVDVYVSYCQTDTAWMLSRLQMYWRTKSTDIFIKGGIYDHAEGEAPVPTVKFPGTRDNVSAYTAPKLEDIPPYMDDPRGVYLINKTKPGLPLEWTDISKTGRIIESINTQILGIAYNAAVLHWITGEDKYATFAYGLFDTYMNGMNYRKEPFDLTHGHHQTLAGLSTFEVIQEVAILNSLTGIYDYLYYYLDKKGAEKMNVYSNVFKKWADLQINHGVAFNNWNLMEAKNTLNIALMLDDDNKYADKKGNQYFTNFILNSNAERQWSLQKIVNEGYDAATGMWYECPGYSNGVLNDFTGYVSFFDRYYNYDLLEQIPVLKKSVLAMAQYLFPNGYHASFGDSHYGKLNLNAAYQLVANAQKNKKPGQEKLFTRYIKTMQNFYEQTGSGAAERSEAGIKGINALLYSESNIALDEKTDEGNISEFVTPVLSSPNVSYFALRNAFDKQNGLMVAMSGSKGNHMHAGGISMEMYGKGYVLAPEAGIGTSYFQPDYAEYYSQFPAHNTVAIDGISAYPVMKSNHGFEVISSYPASGITKGYFSAISFGNLYFLEPETNSDQTRLTSIIRTSDSTAYYVDIFRSRRKDGKDKMHDYFYHNMGQQLLVNDSAGKALPMQSTEKLSFGGGHLFAYDYLYDKKSITTDKDINTVFKLAIPGKDEIQMNMWMKGEKGREIFAVKSPKSTAIDRIGLPKEIAELPMPTIIARQTGEAWTNPFAVVFEPSTTTQPKSVISIQSFKAVNATPDFVGLEIEEKAGARQFVFSASENKNEIVKGDKLFLGTYAVISEINNGLNYLFLGNGNKIAKAGYSITAKVTSASAALELENNEWFFTSSVPVSISFPVELFKGKAIYKIALINKIYTGKKIMLKGKTVIAFELPALLYSKIEFK